VRAHRHLLTGAALAVVAAVALLLPWWREPDTPALLAAGPTVAAAPETWAGWEALGGGPTGLIVLLTGAAVAAAALRRAAWRHLVGAVGGAAVVAAVAVAIERGSAAQGAGIAALSGLGAAAVAVVAGHPRITGLPAVAAGAVAVIAAGWVAPGPAATPPRPDGPFVRVGPLDAGAFRSGTAGTHAPRPFLAVVNGGAALLTEDGVVTLDGSGRARVLARVPADDRGRARGILGVAGDRIARWVDSDEIMITGLRAGDPLAVRIRGVTAAGHVGDDGSLWLRARSDPLSTVRRLDLDAYEGVPDLAAVYLPVVTIDAPVGSAALDVDGLLSTPGGTVRTAAGGTRFDFIEPAPGRLEVATFAGGLDPTCGLTADPRAASLTGAGPLTVSPDGELWFVNGGTTVVGVGRDGEMRVVPTPAPGPVSSLVATPDGAVVLALADAEGPALWRLPDAASHLVALPPTPAGCAADPPPVGPPAALVPVANTSGDPLGVPLDTTGTWASGGGGLITAVTPDGRRLALGTRRDPGPVVPDGAGGIWWLEEAGARATLVHGRPGRPAERLPAVDRPAPERGSALVPDLGGRPPLIGTAAGAFRISGGTLVPVVAGRIDGGAVRADGRGWLLADGRLVATDGDRTLGPVIDAGDARASGVPVAVQLAKGVPPTRLALPRAHAGLDARGRAVVVTDGVVLAVDDAGTVTPVAQDPRLDAPFTAAGGLVQDDDGTLSRVDLPR
jgi:hypothetical protein